MNIVIVSYYFLWSSSVGSRRIGGLARALAADGHSVTVIASAPPDGRRGFVPDGITVIETPHRDRILMARAALSRLRHPMDSSRPSPDGPPTQQPASTRLPAARSTIKSEARKWASFPDTMWEWSRAAQHAARMQQPPDVVIASAPPMAGLQAAAKLASHWRCPWIADMRDLWTGDPNRGVPHALRRLDRRLERRVLSSASAITTVAVALAAELGQTFEATPITVLRNGFDPEWLRTDDHPPAADATIVYTGTLTSNTGRNIDELCRIATQLLVVRRDGVSVPDIDVFGAVDPSVPRIIDEHDVGEIIRLRGVVDATRVRAAQHGAAALLNLSWENTNDATNLPAKLFEYAAARRPVLHLGRVETLGTRLIRDHELGFVRDPADVASVVDLIIEIAAGGTGWTPARPDELEPLSQVTMIDGFRRVIESTVG